MLFTVGCSQTRPENTFIRVNNVGYLPGDAKIAVLSSDRPIEGNFTVGDFKGPVGPDQGRWGPFAHNYRLDFSAVKSPGQYRVRAGGVESPAFGVGEDVYAQVPHALLSFMKLQRCGPAPNAVTGRPCHVHDAVDVESGRKVDLTGGWHDAADRIKHMITTTYCVAALQLAGAREEGDWGARLVKKIHPNPSTIYVQVADDRDHAPPQGLWHEDRTDYGHGSGGARPGWPATGKPQGPTHQNQSTGKASLAARGAAAMALSGDLPAARSMYSLAKSSPGVAHSVPVKAPHYYGEATYLDDMEWAAAELYIATNEPPFLEDALRYATLAHDAGWMGRDRHGHYEFFPYVNLGHWRLGRMVGLKERLRLADYYRSGLEKCRERAEGNPYRLGTPLTWCSTNNVVALATQAVVYEQMTGDRTYRALATEARDWIFGRNPWGKSFVINVPADEALSSHHPHHLFYKKGNHLPTGGLVDGPVYKDINDSLKFAEWGEDPLARFQSDVGVYHDKFEDFSTNEPIIDGTVSLLLLLRVWEAAPSVAAVNVPH